MVTVWLPNIASYDTGLQKGVSAKEYLIPTVDGNDIDVKTGEKIAIDETLMKASQRLELIQKRKHGSPVVVFKSSKQKYEKHENEEGQCHYEKA